MSYTKRTWDCGDKITADALNHMEQGIYDAQDKGYECVETYSTLLQESVTTTDEGGYAGGTLAYNELIDVDKVRITINGTVYECEVSVIESALGRKTYVYGASDPTFSEYPFAISSFMPLETSVGATTSLATQTAGTYNVKIETVTETAETSECFCKAVNECVDLGYECVEGYSLIFEETVTTVADGSDANAQLSYNSPLSVNKIKVTVNGTEYECELQTSQTPSGTNYVYGDADGSYSEYPFGLGFSEDGIDNFLYTQTAGTYSLKVEIDSVTVETSECFKKAVNSAVVGSLCIKFDHETSEQKYIYDKTWQELIDAYNADRLIFAKDHGGNVCYLSTINLAGMEAYFMYSNGTSIRERTLIADSDDDYLYYQSV